MKHAGRLLTILILLLTTLCSTVQAGERSITVLTNNWRPYINAADEAPGSAATMLDVVAADMQARIDWRYLPYGSAYKLVREGKATLAFPYFFTAERSNEVLYSKPLISVTSRIYFNRQFLTVEKADSDFDNLRIGKVDGYSYGAKLDRLLKDAQPYASEKAALVALFNNDIDLLPMTEGVMDATLESLYPHKMELIAPVPGNDRTDHSDLHVIASRTPEGTALIARIDESIVNMEIKPAREVPASTRQRPDDVAQLVPAEGHPAIVGYEQTKSGRKYYSLPLGTRVLVIKWNEAVINSSDNDRLWESMNKESDLVILNGPQIGKVLKVKNIHIQLQ